MNCLTKLVKEQDLRVANSVAAFELSLDRKTRNLNCKSKSGFEKHTNNPRVKCAKLQIYFKIFVLSISNFFFAIVTWWPVVKSRKNKT